MKEKIVAFIKSTFSEANGSASASRVLAGSTVGSTLVWVSYLVFSQHQLPDLHGAAMFVAAGFSGYGINKISVALKGSETKDN